MKDLKDMSNAELCSRLLLMWGFNKMEGGTQKYVTDEEQDLISKIIAKRTEEYGVKVPVELGYIISICSDGNPGMAIILYHNLLQKTFERRGPLPRGYIPTHEDFSFAYPSSFPLASDEKEREKFEKMWDEQKDEKGNNKVDMRTYWAQFFEEVSNE